MPRACAVCGNAARGSIDTAIVTRVPYRDIAKRHGLTSSGCGDMPRATFPKQW